MNQLTTWQAASHIAAATSDYATDWYNVLQENRREHYSISKNYGVIRKGNTHKYGWIRCERVNGRYIYDQEHLDQWIQARLKTTPFSPKYISPSHRLLRKAQSFAAKHGITF